MPYEKRHEKKIFFSQFRKKSYLCKLIRSVQMERNIDTTVQFSGLKSGVYHYDYTLDDSFFSEYKNEKILGCKVVFNVKLEKKERLMLFHFTFSGEVRTTCDRCLGEMELPVSGEETLCVKFSDTEHSDDEDVVILPEKEYKIDLAQWMYEYVAVALPMQCIHPDNADGTPGCDPEMMKYLTEDTDGNEQSSEEETDPRWNALKELKNK